MSAQEAAQYPGEDGWVYITTDRAFARTHADSADGTGGGHLYRVEPLDKPVADHDGIAGMDVQCRRARVVAVAERDVYLSPREIVRGQARHTLYVDGSPGADPVTGRWLAPQDPALRTPKMLASIDRQNAEFDEAQAIYDRIGADGWKAMRRSAGAPPTMSPPTH